MILISESNKHLSLKIPHRCEKPRIKIDFINLKKGCRYDILR